MAGFSVFQTAAISLNSNLSALPSEVSSFSSPSSLSYQQQESQPFAQVKHFSFVPSICPSCSPCLERPLLSEPSIQILSRSSRSSSDPNSSRTPSLTQPIAASPFLSFQSTHWPHDPAANFWGQGSETRGSKNCMRLKSVTSGSPVAVG